MTQDEIIRMAREAGFIPNGQAERAWLERFAALVAAHERERVMSEPLTKAMWNRFESEVRADEREACAKVCDDIDTDSMIQNWKSVDECAKQCAAAIRARGDK